MEANTATTPIASLINQFELQTRLFNNVLDSVNDEVGDKNMKEDMNHLSWLTGHVLSARFLLANLLGIPDKEPYAEFFAMSKGLQKGIKYPSVSEIKKAWNPISNKLLARLNTLSELELSAKAPFPLPLGSDNFKSLIAFISHHEAYTIGQMGLLRRYHGLPGMKYN